MLLKAKVLERIAHGEVDLVFRSWARPTIKEGTRLRTSIGAIVVGKVTSIGLAEISGEDVRRAGFNNVTALMDDLRTGKDREIFRVELAGVESDERLSRQNEELAIDEAAALATSLARWDKTAPIESYHANILRIISQHPGVAAIELAKLLGVEKLKFKRDVRKLKELGLTISLDIGYQLSLRGQSLLKELK
ncbi:hypothetical protein [Phyllobacterium sp. YR531]|uniref:hypothetical protein n=1 Tax=Phyllobacterium sp. YR531 TaxID=1144343 RepID=UPI00026F5B80|nr:hypothetical protein [Phyllobacterium sp. YR531]EJN03171.1 hypothetical protein PMI41_02718 [Phyllobacterium sp. YR531]